MKEEKEKKEKIVIKKIKIIAIVIVLLYLVISRIVGLFTTKETANIITPATNEHSFIVISECLSKYIEAINSKNPDNVINIYSYKYKTENNITKDNVFDINNLSNIVNFKIDKLYSDYRCFYVYATFYSQTEDMKIEKSNHEFTIQLYKNNTFTIIPKIETKIVQGD